MQKREQKFKDHKLKEELSKLIIPEITTDDRFFNNLYRRRNGILKKKLNLNLFELLVKNEKE